MKRFCTLVTFLACVLISIQCDHKEEPVTPRLFYLQFDKPYINFSSEGGTETVVFSYGSNAGAEMELTGIGYGVEYHFVEGKWKEGAHTYATNSQYGSNDVLDGEWFHAVIPRNGYDNEVIITADANHTGNPRRVIIRIGFLYAGDITIDQQ